VAAMVKRGSGAVDGVLQRGLMLNRARIGRRSI
jgi:hypothetical protein